MDLVIAPFVLFWDLSQKNVGQNAVLNGSARGGRALLMEVFLAWSYEYMKNKEACQGCWV